MTKEENNRYQKKHRKVTEINKFSLALIEMLINSEYVSENKLMKEIKSIVKSNEVLINAIK